MSSLQRNLFVDTADPEAQLAEAKPVNVASVPHRSPFRYPGGKTWFVPPARRWLRSCGGRNHLLIEPFAGGAIVGLSAVFERLVGHTVLAEADPQVSAVWKTILSDECGQLCRRILDFDVTEQNVRAVLDAECASTAEMAFATIIRNRMQHGGILAPGASLIRHGEAGKGLRSRWYPTTLVARMQAIHAERHRISFGEADGLKLLRKYAKRSSAVAFVDPPYTASKKSAGNRLYSVHALDHDELFGLCAKFKGSVVMTYDESDEVRRLAEKHGMACRPILMKSRRHSLMHELVIGNNLDWMAESGN